MSAALSLSAGVSMVRTPAPGAPSVPLVPPRPGWPLALPPTPPGALQGDDPTLSYVLLVEVRHARSRKEGEWLLGCAFARELSEYELKALL